MFVTILRKSVNFILSYKSYDLNFSENLVSTEKLDIATCKMFSRKQKIEIFYIRNHKSEEQIIHLKFEELFYNMYIFTGANLQSDQNADHMAHRS